MKHLWLILFVTIELIRGQELNFKNNHNDIIKIKSGQKLHINDNKYTLIKTDYSNGYIVLNKYDSEAKDTLTFNSVVSFRYDEKSLKSFTSSLLKGTKYGVLAGALLGIPEAINYGFHWVVLGGLVYGTLGAVGGAVYGIMIPVESNELILTDKEWQIIK